MSWASPSDFFAMGGYAVYVWGAYGVTALCMLIDPLQAARRHRRALATAAEDVSDHGPVGPTAPNEAR